MQYRSNITPIIFVGTLILFLSSMMLSSVVVLSFEAFVYCIVLINDPNIISPPLSSRTSFVYSLIAQGKTLSEAVRKAKMKVTMPYRRRFELVFGDYWGINFLFPAVIIFKQSNNGLNYDGIKIG